MRERARRHKRTADADQRNLSLHVLPRWGNRPYEAIGHAYRTSRRCRRSRQEPNAMRRAISVDLYA
jgi:hypothetical protein